MKTLQEVQRAKQVSMDELFDNLGVFFAFSSKQFDDAKTPLAEGDKYVQFANGSFVPKSNYDKLVAGFELAEATMREQINANDLGEAEVLAELENQEAFYTGSIESTMEALGDDYSREFVKSVYFKNQNKYDDDQSWIN